MLINNVLFNCSLSDIIAELQSQLAINNIQLLQKTKDGPDNIQVQCPYHKNGQERRPSAGIRKSDGLFHCLACGETHPLYDVISYCFGYYDPFSEFGWNWLLKNFAIVEKEERKDVNLNLSRDLCVTKSVNYVSEEELDSYRYYHPYWTKRGITDEHIIELFDLGFDKKTNSITFPVRDVEGRTLFVARRSVQTKFFNYPEGVEKPLYGIYELSSVHSKINEIIITESMLDALSFWQVGKYAVALNGTGNELQFKQLRQMPCRKFILATDNDSAGMKARKRIRQNVKNKLITEYIFPDGKKDANDCSREELLNLEEIF